MRKTSFLIAACLAFAPMAQARDFLRAEGQHIVDGSGKPVILRGMGLGGWMLQEGYMLDIEGTGTQRSIHARIADLIGPEQADAFYQAWRDNHTTKADVDAMASWGFNSIRLPMHYALYTLPVEQEPVAGQQTWLEEGFRRTDELLAWAKANDIYLILDLHAAPGGQGNDINISDRDPDAPSLWDDKRHQDKMVALWKRLAERYKDEPYIGAYDIINEPNWGFADASDKNGCKENSNGPLRDLLVRTTAAIREVDKRHLVIIEGNCWGNNYRGVLDQGPWDDNLAISFHKYWNDTGRSSLAEFLALREKHDMPLWLGETGENSNDWFARTVALVEGEGIGWAWWPLKKLRYNNPLQVIANDGYRQVLAFWNGKGPRPSRQDAEAALMTLARHDVRYENNVLHPDVVDALFRAPHSDMAAPFRKHAIGAGGGRIAAIDFDMGRDGVAYHDLTPANQHVSDGGERVAWNPAMAYRNDGVDLVRDDDGRLRVGGLEAGEWLKYTFDAEQAGGFDLQLATRGRGKMSLLLNGQAIPARATRDAGTAFAGLPLQAGRNTLVIRAEDGPFDLESLDFSR
jgi:endoglucanase